MANTRRLDFLDVIRGVAIFAVVLTHSAALILGASSPSSLTSLLSSILSTFRYGVELFFLLSGFLLGYIYDEAQSVKKFLVMRFFRLWPLWAVFTLAWFTKGLISSSHFNGSNIFEALYNLLFLGWAFPGTNNSFIGGQWSIQVEVFCYLLFILVRGRSTTWLLGTLITLNCIGIVNNGILKFASPSLAAPLSNLSVWSGFSFFALGILASRAYRSKNGVNHLGEIFDRPRTRVIAMVAGLSTICAPAYYGNFFESLGFVTLAMLTALLISYSPTLKRLTRWLGLHSYSIFFSHFFVLLSLEIVIGNSRFTTFESLVVLVTAFPATLALSSIFAVFTMKFIESPSLKLGRKLLLPRT